MTPEELDEATVEEAKRRWDSSASAIPDIATIAARLAREGWTPPKPEPVDPDMLAFREFAASKQPNVKKEIEAGGWDTHNLARYYLAGARMAREQERERAKVLVEYVEIHTRRLDGVGGRAVAALAKYRGEA